MDSTSNNIGGKSQEEIEKEVQLLMEDLAKKESGEVLAQSSVKRVIGDEIVPDQDAKAMCRDIVAVLKKLQDKRDMNANEVKLVLAIEDPEARQNRRLGVDTESISRNDVAAALVEVAEGKLPKDRFALAQLHKDMMEWPYIEPTFQKDGSRSEQDMKNSDEGIQGESGLRAKFKEFVGFTVLYGTTIFPILIAGAVVYLFFVTSLK